MRSLFSKFYCALCFYVIFSMFLAFLYFLFDKYLLKFQEQKYFNVVEIRQKELSTCNIPDFDIWDPEVAHFYRKEDDPKCSTEMPKWSHIDHTTNELIMEKNQMGQDLSCCFMYLTRTSDKTLRPDFDVDFSSCTSITSNRTKILNGEFIIVECRKRDDIKYRMFHALIPSTKANHSTSTATRVLPPNVLVLGLDSTSRLNFYRFMNKTKTVLESLGAIEMQRFNKAGEGTYYNMIGMLAGYSYEELESVCLESPSDFHDNCPYIWSHFEDAGYLTGHLEDGNTFSYRRKGFRKQPTDFYIRPLFLAAYNYQKLMGKREPKGYHEKRCIGYQSTTEAGLEYVEAMLNYGKRMQRPIFPFLWSAMASHDHVVGIRYVDSTYADFLQRLSEKGDLDNTILIVIGDHGYRYGPVRQTTMGYYEAKLPTLWIYLPERIRKLKPEWMEALRHNSKMLISPYAFYNTMHLILKTFSNDSYKPPKDQKELKTGLTVKRKFKYDFFQSLEPLTCQGLRIHEAFCACNRPLDLSTKDFRVTRAVNLAINHINKNLINKKCSELSLFSVEKAALLEKAWLQGDQLRILVSFRTNPGQGQFEAEMDYFLKSKKFNSSKISVKRVNSIVEKDLKCIQDANMELYCHCKPPQRNPKNIGSRIYIRKLQKGMRRYLGQVFDIDILKDNVQFV